MKNKTLTIKIDFISTKDNKYNIVVGAGWEDINLNDLILLENNNVFEKVLPALFIKVQKEAVKNIFKESEGNLT